LAIAAVRRRDVADDGRRIWLGPGSPAYLRVIGTRHEKKGRPFIGRPFFVGWTDGYAVATGSSDLRRALPARDPAVEQSVGCDSLRAVNQGDAPIALAIKYAINGLP
jgi:hypothetical protein